MNNIDQASQWFAVALQSGWGWGLALMPLSLLGTLASLLWRRRRTAAAVQRATSLASNAAGISFTHHARSQLVQELARARRYQRPMAIAVMRLENDAFVGQKNGSFPSPQLAVFLAGGMMRATMRESDILTYDSANDQYVFLLTESTKVQAWQAIRRLQDLLRRRILIRLQAGIAGFPGDGLTLEDLISRAREGFADSPFGGTSIRIDK